jgi:hypothetical protein
LAERTIGLVARAEPLADACDVELVLAVLALHVWKAPVDSMHHAVADIALFNAVHLLVDVALPQQNGRDDVSVALLNEVLDRQSPLPDLALF